MIAVECVAGKNDLMAVCVVDGFFFVRSLMPVVDFTEGEEN